MPFVCLCGRFGKGGGGGGWEGWNGGSRALCQDQVKGKDVYSVCATAQVDELPIVSQLVHQVGRLDAPAFCHTESGKMLSQGKQDVGNVPTCLWVTIYVDLAPRPEPLQYVMFCSCRGMKTTEGCLCNLLQVGLTDMPAV